MEFPRQKDKANGWTIKFAFLEKVRKTARESDSPDNPYGDVCLEDVEAVLLASEKHV